MKDGKPEILSLVISSGNKMLAATLALTLNASSSDKPSSRDNCTGSRDSKTCGVCLDVDCVEDMTATIYIILYLFRGVVHASRVFVVVVRGAKSNKRGRVKELYTVVQDPLSELVVSQLL